MWLRTKGLWREPWVLIPSCSSFSQELGLNQCSQDHVLLGQSETTVMHVCSTVILRCLFHALGYTLTSKFPTTYTLPPTIVLEDLRVMHLRWIIGSMFESLSPFPEEIKRHTKAGSLTSCPINDQSWMVLKWNTVLLHCFVVISWSDYVSHLCSHRKGPNKPLLNERI